MGIQKKQILKDKEEQQPEQENAKPNASMAQMEVSNNTNAIGAALGMPKRNPPNNQAGVPLGTMENRQRPKPMPYRPPSMADRNRVGPVSPVLGVGSPIKRPDADTLSMAEDNRRMYKNRRPEIRDPRQLEQMQEYMPENQPSPMAEEYARMYKNRRPVRRFEDGGVDLGGWTPEEVMQQEQELENSINQYEKYGDKFEPDPIPQGVVESGQMTQEEFDKSRGNDTQKKRSNFEIPEERPFNFSQGQKVGSFDVGQGVDMKSNAENLEARKKSIMGLLKGGM